MAGPDITPEAFMKMVTRRTHHRGAFREDMEVSDERIQFILEAARWAPTAANTQPCEFIVIRDRKTREAITKLAKKQQKDKLEMEWVTRRSRVVGADLDTGLLQAPVYIVVISDPRTIKAYPERTRLDKWQSHYFGSVSNVVLTMVLAAEALGLGYQWLSDVASPYFATMLKAKLGIPDPLQVSYLIPIGYVDKRLQPNPRRPLTELVHSERYDMAKFRNDQQFDAFLDHLQALWEEPAGDAPAVAR